MARAKAHDLTTGLCGLALENDAPRQISWAPPKLGVDKVGNAPQQQPHRCRQRQQISKERFAFAWIVDFPIYEKDEETGKIDFEHNPFSMPQGGHSALEGHSASVLAGGQIPHEHRQEGLVDDQRRAGSQTPWARADEIPTFQHMAWGTVWKDLLAFPVQAMR